MMGQEATVNSKENESSSIHWMWKVVIVDLGGGGLLPGIESQSSGHFTAEPNVAVTCLEDFQHTIW